MQRNPYHSLNSYSIIGDLHTTALVSKYGSIDWLCLPRMDSPSVFASILDANNGGYFAIHPTSTYQSTQQYWNNTLILETHFNSAQAEAVLTDFMPINDNVKKNTIIRKLEMRKGAMEFALEFHPQLNYAQENTSVEVVNQQLKVLGKNNQLLLYDLNQHAVITGETKEFELDEGEVHWFVLQHNQEQELRLSEVEAKLQAAKSYWQDWAKSAEDELKNFQPQDRQLVMRSALTLKSMINKETGAIVAAATTSLPERLGGDLNWDYRYCWLRDASMSIQALSRLGHTEEALNFFHWTRQTCAYCLDTGSDLQIMYGIDDTADLQEKLLDHLEGYKQSSPVRIGNEAHSQVQLDIYGAYINAFFEVENLTSSMDEEDWVFVSKLADFVCINWQNTDHGLWEARGKQRHYTHTKLMCWLALDRTIKLAQKYERKIEDNWLKNLNALKAEILEKGFNNDLGTFVQTFSGEEIDAANLLIARYELLPLDDYRVEQTIEAIETNLMENNLVYRNSQSLTDSPEGTFTLAGYWLVEIYARKGQKQKARDLFDHINSHASVTGLLSEEIDPETGELLGNYPQAFSHIGLINAAWALAEADV